MTGLGKRIEELKGARTVEEICRQSKNSRQAYHDLRRGKPVRLNTLLKFSKTLKASRKQKLELVREWVFVQLGSRLRQNFRVTIKK